MDDGQKPTRRVSLVDVANKAFVHHSTASRALAGSPQVSEHNARPVRAAAEELGYFPGEKFITPPLSAVFLDGEASGRAVGNVVSSILDGKSDRLADFPWSLVERVTTRLS